jgi:hypothetical protein
MKRERRAHKRYVIDGLMLDIAGILHETVDVSARAVALVAKPGVDYDDLKGEARFAGRVGLACPILKLRKLGERQARVVLRYVVDRDDWERALADHDVRADIVPLEDVFG